MGIIRVGGEPSGVLRVDLYSGKRIAVSTTDEMHDSDRARLQTFRDVIAEFRTHPEAKSADVEGRSCDRRTVGLLKRRVVQETHVSYVGKEANKPKEVGRVLSGMLRLSTRSIALLIGTPGPKESCQD